MTTTSIRRTVWAAGAAIVAAGLLVWIFGTGPDDAGGAPSQPESAAATPGSEPTATRTAESAPSSGPTTTPSPSPSPGSLQEVPVEEATSAPAVPLTATADFGTGLTLRMDRIESVFGEARGPGQIAGPALRLTLTMTNRSDSAVSLEGAVVDLTVGRDRTPTALLTGPGVKEFQGEVAAGDSVTAAYVFAVPEDARDRLRVAVSYVADAPVVVLRGAAG